MWFGTLSQKTSRSLNNRHRLATGYRVETMELRQIYIGKFVYRCPKCGEETPKEPVSLSELGPAEEHECPRKVQPDVEA
jgi:hypothetical protein